MSFELHRLIALPVLLSILPLCSCSLVQPSDGSPVYGKELPPRVVERDLSTASSKGIIDRDPGVSDVGYGLPVPGGQFLNQGVVRGANGPSYFIEFGNESWHLPKRGLGDVLAAAQAMSSDQRVVIVGNSHGASGVGTGKLARKRADEVYLYLVSSGIDASLMHRMASWDSSPVDHSPSRGVTVLFVSITDPSVLFVTLTKL